MAQRSYLFLLAILLSICAVFDGSYLSLVHVDLEVGQGGLSTVCHKLAKAGCSVTAGKFGDIAGIPVALIGTAAAMVTAITAAVAWFRRTEASDPNRRILWGLASTSFAVSIIMAGFSWLEGSFCPFCVLWYGLNLGLVVCIYLATSIEDRKLSSVLADLTTRSGIRTVLVAGVIFSLLAWSYFSYRSDLLQQRAIHLQMQVRQLKLAGRSEINWPTELAEQGPQGPQDPEVSIYEFSDFQCPHCRRLWENVHAVQQRSSRKIKVAFINYPLDSACNRNVEGPAHDYACIAAQAAECARKQGKFWSYADLLFDNQDALRRDDLLDYAGQIELDASEFAQCIDAEDTLAKIQKDIEFGEKIRIAGTPTYFVNDYRLTGAPPAPLLNGLIEQLLEDSSDPSSQGIH